LAPAENITGGIAAPRPEPQAEPPLQPTERMAERGL
jgi:hypothetical protein